MIVWDEFIVAIIVRNKVSSGSGGAGLGEGTERAFPVSVSVKMQKFTKLAFRLLIVLKKGSDGS